MTKLEPLEFPYETKLQITATVSPACASRGDEVTIVIKAPKSSAIAYQAVYSDNQGGGDPPFGQGYGGNDYSDSNPRRTFESSWVIKPHAPFGRGRVDVVVGFERKWGYAGPHFAVADADGKCPEQWLRGGKDDA